MIDLYEYNNRTQRQKKFYKFKIFHTTSRTKMITDWLVKCDVWLSDTQLILEEDVSFTYSGEDKPIEYFHSLLIKAFEAAEMSVKAIEGGEVRIL